MNYLIEPLVNVVRNHGIKACEQKALELANLICLRGPICNVGGGITGRWPNAKVIDARINIDLDFNTKWLPFDDNVFDLVVCEQVIEHLHNTTWFLNELHRILMPGGTLLLSTENLASLPNLFAILCQQAPFSTQAVCGQFIGGWKKGIAGEGYNYKPNHPVYSGVRGHVRVMTTGQLKVLLRTAGFTVKNKYGYGGNHYILFHAVCNK